MDASTEKREKTWRPRLTPLPLRTHNATSLRQVKVLAAGAVEGRHARVALPPQVVVKE